MLSGVKFIPRNELDEDEEEGGRTRKKSWKKKSLKSESSGDDTSKSRKHSSSHAEVRSLKENSSVRKEMGLDWMLKGAYDCKTKEDAVESNFYEEPDAKEENSNVNARELNPFLKNNGTGYPEDEHTNSSDKLSSSSLVGDGGASWRMKALKRAKEQAAREGRRLDEVVEDRWGSLGHLAVSAASSVAAPAHAHLHAIRHRRQEVMKESSTFEEGDQKSSQRYLKNSSARHHGMKEPKAYDSLSWGSKKRNKSSIADDPLLMNAAASINKFVDDGSFMSTFLKGKNVESGCSTSEKNVTSEEKFPNVKEKEDASEVKEKLSANQLAAKALQLRLKEKHEDAEKLLQQQASFVDPPAPLIKERNIGRNAKFSSRDVSSRKMENDGDKILAQTILKNRKFSSSSQADDEYDYDIAPSKKSKQKVSRDHDNPRRFTTQQERCIFCFENPNRPKHLVISIANFTYLMLPQNQPLTEGHCCILPLQHESSARNVDNDVWEEIRNFKKCLIMMFSKHDKELVFLETVIDLAKQTRHCLIDCIPLPRDLAKQAPLYFKKAIDEAEDEWSQHNAKKLIDTTEKGLRGSIPKNFPYFHVEFGLDRGFVHVIDDENNFKTELGLNVIRGMLRLPEEDMYRHRRRESRHVQAEAVANFMQDWQHFDWTKQL